MKQPNLKALRARYGLTVRQAARLCGISTSTWWLTESGQNALRPETIEKITNALRGYKKG